MLGCPFSQEPRWTTEVFTRMYCFHGDMVKNGFSLFKKIQSLDFFFHHLLGENWHKIVSVNTAPIKFWQRLFSSFAVNRFHYMWRLIKNSLCQTELFFFSQISWNSNHWIVENRLVSAKGLSLKFSSDCACVACGWVPQVPPIREQTKCKSVTIRFSPCLL